MKYVKLFEEHNSAYEPEYHTVYTLVEKCFELQKIIKDWANETKVKDLNLIKDLKDNTVGQISVGTQVRKWLEKLFNKEDAVLWKHPIEKTAFSGNSRGKGLKPFFTDYQTFFHIRFTINGYPAHYPYYVRIGHNGKQLVVSVPDMSDSQHKFTESLIKYIDDHFDPEYKIDNMTIDEFIHKKRGYVSGKKFGF
jgi:hypothetical protein